MPREIACPACSRLLHVDETSAPAVRCPGCGELVSLHTPTAANAFSVDPLSADKPGDYGADSDAMDFALFRKRMVKNHEIDLAELRAQG